MSESPQDTVDEAWLLALPKVSLHCHLEGTLAPASFRTLAEKYTIDFGERMTRPDDALYAFTTFYEFLMTFKDVCVALREPADYAMLAREYIAQAAADGVVAAEIFVSPAAWLRLHPDLDVRAVFEAIAHALQREGAKHGIDVALICDLTRNFGVDVAMQTVDIAIAMRDLNVVGIGLGGDEANFPAALFIEPFRRAQAAGLRCVAHAGEVAGPQSVRDAVDLLGAERIGHGVRAVEDPQLLRMLARRGIVLEQSPSSNRRTGAVHGAHPMKTFIEADIRVAVDADDPAIFGASILDEYRDLARQYGSEFVVDRAYDAVFASFLSPDRKQAIFTRLAAHGEQTFPEFSKQSTKGR